MSAHVDKIAGSAEPHPAPLPQPEHAAALRVNLRVAGGVANSKRSITCQLRGLVHMIMISFTEFEFIHDRCHCSMMHDCEIVDGAMKSNEC